MGTNESSLSQSDNRKDPWGRTASTTETAMEAASNQSRLDKFGAAQGHGFAAEDANTLADRWSGKNAKVIGDDNARNGADRIVDGTLIQTKYCQSASDSVAAAFRDGKYRYITSEGAVMDLEVPADQYEQAVELMEERIRNGEVPGVTDPAKAKEIVRKGHFTYAQARNIARFGTIESLTFDAAQGAVICASACGITAALTFIQSMWNDADPQEALENAACAGIQVGGIAFVASVVGSQLMRTGLRGALTKLTDAVTKLIGPKLSAQVLKLLKPGSTLAGAAAMKSLSKMLRGNILTGTLTVALMSAKDIGNLCRGRISGGQMFKNLMVNVSAAACGTGGYMVGNYLLTLIPGAGPVLGFVVPTAAAVAAGMGSEAAARNTAGQFAEDDAVQMVSIVEEVFAKHALDYLLTEDEVEIVLDDLTRALKGETLLDMYASRDREAFAADIVDRCIEKLIRGRCGYFTASLNNANWASALNAIQNGQLVPRSSGPQMDPVEVGRELLGRELSPQAARKGMYAAKQMNMRLAQSELRLMQMAEDERRFNAEMREIVERREDVISQINELMGDLF